MKRDFCWTLQVFTSSCPTQPLLQQLRPLQRQPLASLPAAPGRLCTRLLTDWMDVNIVYQANAKQMKSNK